MIWGWLVGLIAAASGAFTALARVYKWGPFLEDSTIPESDLDLVEPTERPQDEPLPQVVPVSPTQAPTEAVAPPKHMLDTFCTALRDFEGKPGDANYRNNNPGNFRYSPVGYLAKYGGVGRSPDDFAIFRTYALGWEYLQASVLHTATTHPAWTIYNFFANYAPEDDGNDPKHYAETVAKDCGVVPTITLQALFA